MTKNEKYDALKTKGISLKHINNLSADEVDSLYIQHFGPEETPPEGNDDQTPLDGGNTPPGPAEKPEPVKKFLKFKTSGWCEELEMSYKKGVYHPKSEKEYRALKKYAVQE